MISRPFNTPINYIHWGYDEDGVFTRTILTYDPNSDKSSQPIKQKRERDYHSYLVSVFNRELNLIEDNRKKVTNEEYYRLLGHYERYRDMNRKHHRR